MSARSKAAGAAMKVAAPEAAGAEVLARRHSANRKNRNLNTLPDHAHDAELEDRKNAAADRQWLKANGHPTTHPDEDQADEHEHEDQADDAGGRFAPFAGMQGPATGGGFALGLITWALVRAYIGNPGHPSGAAGVKALLLAKFLNKTAAK